jgi:hypothetical protein
MSSNNDSAGKGQPKPPGGGEAPKKPSALLDLKPSEVDVHVPGAAPPKADPKAAEAGAKPGDDKSSDKTGSADKSAAGSAPAAPDKTATDKNGVGDKPAPGDKSGMAASKPATATVAGVAAGAASAAATAAGAKPAAGGGGDGKPGAAAVASAKSSGGGLRGAATHLAAGLAGGLLAMFGADTILPHIRPVDKQSSALSPAVETRLSNLEQIAARPVPPELSQRLESAEARLGELARTASAVAEQQTALAGETRAIGARLAETKPESAAPEDRIAKLEEILNALSAAAASDPQKGRIPQLVALTGRLTDLEASIATQLAQLRKGVTQEVDSRLAQSAEAAEAARMGTQRLDRELAGVKTESAQVVQRVDGVKSQSDRLEVALKGLGEQVGALKGDLAREVKDVARAADLSKALAPVTAKIASLEQNLQGVVRSEGDRRANVERIVTALELGNLKRTVDRGVPFAKELAEVRKVAGAGLKLEALERNKDRGVPTLAELERDFRSVAFSIIDAEKQPSDAHWTDRLIASAQSVVRVRKVDQGADDKSVEAVVSRMEASLKGGRLVEVMSEAGKLPAQARAAGKAWLDKVEARSAVDQAITAIEQDLKASLGAQSQAGKKG